MGFSRPASRRGKNDKIDSYRIARYAYLHQDEARLWIPQRKVVQQLAHLTALRKRLLKTKVALQQPLNETKCFLGNTAFRTEQAATDPVVKITKEQLKWVEKKIKGLIHEDEVLRELFELVTSVEAVGPITAGHLLVVTNEFKNFNCPKKFACYAGTAPFENSSGTSIRAAAARERVTCLLMLIKRRKSCYIWQPYRLSICRMRWQAIISEKYQQAKTKWRLSMP